MTISKLLRGKLLVAVAVTAALILSVIAFSKYGYVPVQAASDEQPTKRTINVSGQGLVNASPDIAYVTLGVVTEDTDAKTAQRTNASSMDKVVAQIKTSGVKSDDIKTVNYSIYPKYDYNQKTGVSKIIGYSVNNTIKVTVRDISKAGAIIDLAGDSGINTSNSISFGLSDYDKYYNEALKNAVQVAKKKAETLAGPFGIVLKMPVSVSENGGSGPVYNYPMYDAKAASMEAVATPVQAGTMEIRANVSMVYEY